jgi:hypothetical protein
MNRLGPRTEICGTPDVGTLTSVSPVKKQAYKFLVRPSLEYACSVWDPYTKENIIQLEQVQRRAAR